LDILNGTAQPPPTVVQPPIYTPPPTVVQPPIYTPPPTVVQPPIYTPPTTKPGRGRRGGAKNEAAILKLMTGGLSIRRAERFISPEASIISPEAPIGVWSPEAPIISPELPIRVLHEDAVARERARIHALERSMVENKNPDAGPPYTAQTFMDGRSFILDKNGKVVLANSPIPRAPISVHDKRFHEQSLQEIYNEGLARAEESIKQLTANYGPKPTAPKIPIVLPRPGPAPPKLPAPYKPPTASPRPGPAPPKLPAPYKPPFRTPRGESDFLRRRRGGGKAESQILKMLNAM
jgi:hypothetical protein